MSKSLSIVLASLFLLLVSCVKPPDVYVCVDVSESTGWCKYTISENEFYVDNFTQRKDGKTWDEIKITSLRVPSESWAKLKAYIINECKKNAHCVKEISSWERKVNAFDSKLTVNGK